MGRSAAMELKGDVEILRRAYEHVRAFADPAGRVMTGDLPDVRPSSWDAAPFKPLGRRTAPVDMPDPRPAAIEDRLRQPSTDTARSRKPDEQVHLLFRPIGSFFGKDAVQPTDNKVFVVHGHDHGPRDAIVAVLLRLGLDPVVLEDETNRGRTLIEKFEQHAEVKYAVVVVTPEDEVTSEGGGREMRPRQNVVLEFGYLMGALGRKMVAVIMVGRPTGPSDVQGIAYIAFDEHGGWKLKLARELRDGGFAVNFDALK